MTTTLGSSAACAIAAANTAFNHAQKILRERGALAPADVLQARHPFAAAC
jgi:homoserine kinase